MTKPRTGIPGAKGLSQVVNEESWGAAKALQRTRDYRGPGNDVPPLPPKPIAPELGCEPQFRNTDGRARDWADDVPENSWLRGGGKQAAEGKPNFDHRGNPNNWRGGNNPKLK